MTGGDSSEGEGYFINPVVLRDVARNHPKCPILTRLDVLNEEAAAEETRAAAACTK